MLKEKELKGLWWKINKIKERLIIICDWNIQNGQSPSEEDVQLIKELIHLIESSSVSYLDAEIPDDELTEQQILFPDEVSDKQ